MPQDFVGQDDLLQHLKEDVLKGQSIFLQGGPKTGKTSLLKKFMQELLDVDARSQDGRRYLLGYLCAQSLPPDCTEAQFWQDALEECLGMEPHPAVLEFLDKLKEAKALHRAIKQLLKSLKRENRQLILLLDEVETLVSRPGLPASFYELLRTKSQEELTLVLASRHSRIWVQQQIADKGQSGSQFANQLNQRLLPALELSARHQLLRWGGLTDEKQCALVLALAGGHPYLLHWLGQELMEHSSLQHWKPKLSPLESLCRELWATLTVEKQVQFLRAMVAEGTDPLQHEPDHPPLLLWSAQSARIWLSPADSSSKGPLRRLRPTRELRKWMVGLVKGAEEKKTARRWVNDCGLDSQSIDFDLTVENLCAAILEEAEKQGKCEALIQIIETDYQESRAPSNVNAQTLTESLRRFVADGHLTEAEAQALHQALCKPSFIDERLHKLRQTLSGGCP